MVRSEGSVLGPRETQQSPPPSSLVSAFDRRVLLGNGLGARCGPNHFSSSKHTFVKHSLYILYKMALHYVKVWVCIYSNVAAFLR